MLLTHTSSIIDNWYVIKYYKGDPTMELGKYLKEYLTDTGKLYNAKLNFGIYGPGTKYSYSKTGVALAGYIVEIISG